MQSLGWLKLARGNVCDRAAAYKAQLVVMEAELSVVRANEAALRKQLASSSGSNTNAAIAAGPTASTVSGGGWTLPWQ